MEARVKALDLGHIQPVGEDNQLGPWVLAPVLPPANGNLGRGGWVATVNADAGPAGQPIGGVFQETLGAEGVGQDDPQIAVMLFVPVCQNLIGGLGEFLIGVGQGGIDHWQFMGIGANRLDVAAHGDLAVRGANELRPQPLLHGLHAPVLPQMAVAAARAEIGDFQAFNRAQLFDLFPKPRHGAGVKHLQFELAHGS